MSIHTHMDRREDPRIPVMMQVNYTDGEDFLTDYSTNFSRNGLFINTTQKFGPGEKIHLKFYLPGNERPVRVLGRIRWNKGGAHAVGAHTVPGIGVEFININEFNREMIDEFVDQFLFEDEVLPAAGLKQKPRGSWINELTSDH